MISAVRKLLVILPRGDHYRLVGLLVLMVIGAGLETIGIASIPLFVSLLSDPAQFMERLPFESVRSALAAIPDNDLLLWLSVGLLVLFLIKNLYISALLYFQATYISDRQVAIGRRMLGLYLASPYSFHLRRNSAELLRNANTESLEVVGLVLLPSLNLLRELLTVGAIFLLLLVVEPVASLVAFAVMGGASFIFLRLIRDRLAYHGQQIQEMRGRMIQTVNESLGSIKITKLLGRETQFLEQYAAHARRFTDASRFYLVAIELPRLFLETVALVGLLAVTAIFAAQGRPLAAIIPTISLLAMALVRMVPSFNRITASLTALRYGRYSLEVVYRDLTELKVAITGAVSPSAEARIGRLCHDIGLQDVTFAYEGLDRPVIEGVTINIFRGSAVAFVGTTGAGKTTIVDLILGLLKPQHGQILIDGKDIHGDLSGWQRQIGYVPQDVYLTDDTIARNVALGLPDEMIEEAAIWAALDAAQIGDFVRGLPEGLNTAVGERGVRLSGGQRQRIGIARALYAKPEILVLDEATSNLDYETERSFLNAVESLRGARTIIMIGHRMPAVRTCDRIFVLEAGKLVHQGTYDELVRESANFRVLSGTTS